ncbi:amidohydrolase family protein [Virgibacillus sp. MSJ-26]|uniref:metal-dependent hydrolase family protein n=1 Tax=Virgibacillus sp. MSJ-26 TaxID=2841522 RepID=UPI001C0F4A68|nr:amidohydrolase family protein [Virgibacillus sp. MSJ-26]MBU5465828.1 amidohydrolase family protein [Virgibacillus sp. MSJ-26]
MVYTLIKNGTLIDGNGGQPVQDAAVLVKDNVIEKVGTLSDIPVPNEDVTEVDAQGGYILPGMIDTHVHLMMEIEAVEKQLTTPFSYRFYKAVKHMEKTLHAGVTTVRDAGGTDAGVKKAVEDGLVPGPRMQISVNAITTTGGHGDKWMRSGIDTTLHGYPGSPAGICDGVEEVTKKVREVLRAGADLIKVHATGGVMSPTDHPEFTQFSQEELEVIVREAEYRKGLKVMAHAQGEEGILNAVKAGIHSIEHGIYISDETAQLMIDNGTYLIPTLLAPVSVLEAAESSDSMPSYGVQKAKEVVDAHKESIANAYQKGVKIAMGTDAGVMAHGTNLRELGLMCEAGMSPMESIVASTKVAAECMGWENEIGTVEQGKYADIIITNSDPLADIYSLEENDNIVAVLKDGKLVKNHLSKVPTPSH